MKLHVLGPIVVTLAAAMITGCGPGMSHRAQAPTGASAAIDAGLAHAIVGTAKVTSASLEAMPLPESRMPLSQHVEASAPPLQTWGSGEPEVDPKFSEEYGF